MSRVGKKPIPLPKGVKITVGEHALSVEGPKGKQTVPVPAGITIRQDNGIMELQRDGDARETHWVRSVTSHRGRLAVTGPRQRR